MNEQRPRILIVDDDPFVAETLADLLMGEGYDAVSAIDGESALQAIDDAKSGHGESNHIPRPFQVLITDISLPGMDGLELIRITRMRHLDIVPVVITGYGTIEAAVKAVRMGAVDYLTKPLVDDELRVAVEKAIHQQTLLAENTNLKAQLDQRYGIDNIIGSDSRMVSIFDLVESVAPSKTTVLMCGESGTGKSLIARAIHRLSPRADQPFVEISCGSIPETLLESELFGHVKGAFTGAHVDKVGRFFAADGGTLFLDEINSASPGMQLKLLRVLQEKQFEPVGSTETVEVDVRIILASNQPLEDLVSNGEFRQDLYYRINVVMINLPPLRDRVEDIPILAEHFLHTKAKEVEKQATALTPNAIDVLKDYSYPGNVRELENIIERAVVLAKSPHIDVHDLPPHVVDETTGRKPGSIPDGSSHILSNVASEYVPIPLREALQEPERQIILAALEANQWNRQKTSEQLEINRTTLYKKIKQYDLEKLGRTG